MTRETTFEGRAWFVRDGEGHLIDNIDTDMIFHNAHLAITDVAQMGPLSFGNLPGWKDFPKKAAPGDVLVVGKNFGAGSSRQQAVDCFRALGVAVLVGESFGAIYKRNAINAGMALLECPGLADAGWTDGQRLRVDLVTGLVTNLDTGATREGRPASGVQLDIYRAGDLFAFAKRS